MDTRTTRRKTPASPTIGQLVTSYLNYAEATLAAVTLTSYRDSLRLFITAVGADTPADDVTDLAIVRWQRERLTLGRSPNTVRSDMRRLRAFYGWAMAREHLSRNWAKLASMPKEPDTQGRSTSATEFARLLKFCQGATQYRDRALLWMLHDTGARIGEAGRLELENVDIGDPLKPAGADWQPAAHFPAEITKTRQERWCPFSLDTRNAISDYVAFERGSKPGPLFLSARTGKACHEQTLKHRIREIGALAGVVVGAHDFRRAFVGRLQGAAVPVPDSLVQELGGWKSAAMVRRYGKATATKNAMAAWKKALG